MTTPSSSSGNGAPMLDALAKLELAMRPQSVPSWLSSDTNHAPKVTALGPRRSTVEYMDPHTHKTTSPSAALASIAEYGSAHSVAAKAPVAGSASGPSAASVRPRAPIALQKEPTAAAQEKTFLSKESELSTPKRSRQRARRQPSGESKSRRVKQSLSESLRSIEFFDKTNRSRELSAKYSVMRTLADPAGNVHFVNIDDNDDHDDDDDQIDVRGENSTESPDGKGAGLHTAMFDVTGGVALTANKLKLGASKTGAKAASTARHASAKEAPTESFNIPELPRGQQLVINILSTWGDPFYVGLMGIELFDHTGHAVHLSDVDKQLSADPPDLNGGDHDRVDPRTVDKLVDGHYFTSDALHAWLAPFTRGQNHFIYVDLDYALSLSMIRIWNYNTTRIHSYRGARYVEISLDGTCIFKGEIRRAPGSAVEDTDACHECILFTTSSSILRLIEKYEKQKSDKTALDSAGAAETPPVQELQRPKTGNRANRSAGLGAGVGGGSGSSGSVGGHAIFPLSSVPKPGKAFAHALLGHAAAAAVGASNAAASRPCTAPIMCDATIERPVVCQRVELVFKANWGDPYDVGLAGLQFLDNNYAPLKLSLAESARVTAPHAQAKAERLVATYGARHLSTRADDMWVAPLRSVLGFLPSDRKGALVVEFEQPVTLRALKIWNYNTTLEESFKGAKQIAVYVDGARHSSFSLRKAPGNVMDFDFGQFLYLKSQQQQQQPTSTSPTTTTMSTAEVLAVHSPLKPDGVRREEDTTLLTFHDQPRPLSPPQRAPQSPPESPHGPPGAGGPTIKPIAEVFQQYQTPLFPTGYIVKFVFLSTWGDPFYLGLNGLELYDREDQLVALDETMIDAQPRDINILKDPGAPHDVRTLDKLYDGVHHTYDDRHMWLAPLAPAPQHNKLVLFFNEPVTLSRVRLWNYSKTPARGVKEFEIFLDDVLIFHGLLRQAPALARSSEDDHESELLKLTSDAAENRRLRRRRYERAEAAAAAADMTQAILFTDDARVLASEAPHIYLPDDELEASVTFYDNSQVLSLSDTPLARDALERPTTSAGAGGGGGGGAGRYAGTMYHR